jgi:hypothetical protein
MTDEHHKYRLTYRLTHHPEGLTKEEVLTMRAADEDMGACDACILISIIYGEDGSSSTAIVDGDGRTDGPLSDTEVFRAWGMLANRLSESTTLAPMARKLAEETWLTMKRAVLAGRRPVG